MRYFNKTRHDIPDRFLEPIQIGGVLKNWPTLKKGFSLVSSYTLDRGETEALVAFDKAKELHDMNLNVERGLVQDIVWYHARVVTCKVIAPSQSLELYENLKKVRKGEGCEPSALELRLAGS